MGAPINDYPQQQMIVPDVNITVPSDEVGGFELLAYIIVPLFIAGVGWFMWWWQHKKG